MADWREVAKGEGWVPFRSSVRIRLGARRHTIHVSDVSDELEFYASAPQTDVGQLIELLVSNRSSGLASWHVDDGHAWAVSRCPRSAAKSEMAAHMRETASLADRLELRLSDIDR